MPNMLDSMVPGHDPSMRPVRPGDPDYDPKLAAELEKIARERWAVQNDRIFGLAEWFVRKLQEAGLTLAQASALLREAWLVQEGRAPRKFHRP